MPEMKIEDAAIRDAVVTAIAAQVLQTIDSAHRDTILRQAIETALKSWDFSSAVQKAVATQAAETATRLCATEEWGLRIEATIKDAFETYLRALKENLTRNLPR
jgi:macrodomain Ter protein organizer (MatP/YcbG family)